MPLFQASGSPRPQIAPLARLRTHPPPRTRLPSMRCVVLTALLALTRAEGDEAEGDGAYVSSAPDGEVLFFSNFDEQEAFDKVWTVSTNTDYTGTWGLSEGNTAVQSGDMGLEVKNEARRHAIAAMFPKVVKPVEGEPLVIQYEVKLETPHNCGGMYIKLLKDDPDLADALDGFSGDTEYTIMFGPDKCGGTDKVHFIFKHENPITHAVEEKHAKNPPAISVALETSLYTLVINPDNTYEYFINLESKAKGSLLEDMEPPVNPPKEIDDPTDSKPEDWVDEAKIDDPEASKPDDWDEDAPMQIVDESVSMPEGWDEDAPDTIPDPAAEMPEDWDEEEDGEWEAPKITNPVCEEVGCGKWEAPMISNPEYKGKWYAPQIDNPEYKGVWKAKQIPNPDFFEDKTPYMFAPFSGIGIELWTMTSGIFFDNILITRDPAMAEEYATKTWKAKHDLEVAKKASANAGADPLKMVADGIDDVAAMVTDIGVPEEYSKIAVLSTIAIVILTTLFWCCSGDDDVIEGLEDDDDEEVEEEEPEPAAAEPEKEEEKKEEETNPAAAEEEDSGPTTRSKAKGKKGKKVAD